MCDAVSLGRRVERETSGTFHGSDAGKYVGHSVTLTVAGATITITGLVILVLSAWEIGKPACRGDQCGATGAGYALMLGIPFGLLVLSVGVGVLRRSRGCYWASVVLCLVLAAATLAFAAGASERVDPVPWVFLAVAWLGIAGLVLWPSSKEDLDRHSPADRAARW